MITTVRLTFAAFLTTLTLPAQTVILSEVRADAEGRWVELHNRGAVPVDLSAWSLHHASHTPGMPQEYWWAFPGGTVLQAGGFLRVHWHQAVPATTTPGELFTGNTPYHFLYGLGSEPLSGTRGAFGLMRTQFPEYVAEVAYLEDWLSWGEHGYSREPIAIDADRWTDGRHAPAIPAGSSLARNTATIATLDLHDQQWFVDASPTPLAPNLSGAGVTEYGLGCAVFGHHLLGTPELHAPSLPLLGNAQFKLTVDNTTGIYGEYVMVVWSAGQAPAGQVSVLPPEPGLCSELIDTSNLVSAWLLQAQVISTNVPLSLANMPPELVGSEVHAQALVLDLLPFAYSPIQGLTNGVKIVFGQ
jgi:hypothetical protein